MDDIKIRFSCSKETDEEGEDEYYIHWSWYNDKTSERVSWDNLGVGHNNKEEGIAEARKIAEKYNIKLPDEPEFFDSDRQYSEFEKWKNTLKGPQFHVQKGDFFLESGMGKREKQYEAFFFGYNGMGDHLHFASGNYDKKEDAMNAAFEISNMHGIELPKVTEDEEW